MSFHPIFAFRWFWPTKLRKCLLTFTTETILKKITQPKLPKTKNELTKICNEPGISEKPSEVKPPLALDSISKYSLSLYYLSMPFMGQVKTLHDVFFCMSIS